MTYNSLRESRTQQEFVTACAKIVTTGKHCSFSQTHILSLADEIRDLRSSSFDNWISQDASEQRSDESYLIWLRQSFPNFCLQASLNGGFFEKNSDGQIVQWAAHGSGARAVAAWTEKLWSLQLQPGVDLHSSAEVMQALPHTMTEQTHKEWRLRLAAQFADEHVCKHLLTIFDDITETQGIGFQHADQLAKALPIGFGADPFKKKAILALIAIGTVALGKGLTAVDLPIASDYQIPRILAWKGAIKISDELESALLGEDLLDPLTPEVMEFRAAAVVACNGIARRLGVPDWDIDGRLFGHFRRDPSFVEDALPPMRCNSTWF